MKAVNGYIENGTFTPLESISFQERIPAVLVFEDIVAKKIIADRMAWFQEFREAVTEAEEADEEMPDFPRTELSREFIDVSDEE
jgi:hypothetical protein